MDCNKGYEIKEKEDIFNTKTDEKDNKISQMVIIKRMKEHGENRKK